MMEKAEKSRKKRRWPWIAGGIFGGLVLLVLVAALIVASLLFGGEREFPVDPLRSEDYTLVGKLTGRLLTELRTGKPAESELVLTPNEVESVLRLAANGASLGVMPKGGAAPGGMTPYHIRYENGRFETVAQLRTGLNWLWGGVIMMDTSVRPEKQDEMFDLDISRIKTGSITLPDSLVQWRRKQALEELRNRKEYRQFDRCVKSIQIDDENNFHIVYRPAELVKLLPEETRRLLFLPARKK